MPPKRKAAAKKTQQKQRSPSPVPKRATRGSKRGRTTTQNKTPSPEPVKKVDTKKSKKVADTKKKADDDKKKAKDDKKKDDDDKKKDDDKKADPEPVKLETRIVKGGVAVDKYIPNAEKYHAIVQGGQTYACTLNQTNLGGNNNKFYIIQAVQDDNNANNNYLFTRWGRVGVQGQQAFAGPFDVNQAIAGYNAKKNAKTKGGYSEIFINYEAEDDDDKEEQKDDKKMDEETKRQESKLPIETQKLIGLIFDTKVMEETMKEIGYDPKKMPLGKLADQSIKTGYAVLNQLLTAVKDQKGSETYKELTSQFYTHIPHDFGFQKMINFILNTEEKVREKLNMLAQLTDMKLTANIISQKTSSTDNLIDSHYQKLKCKLTLMDREKRAEEWKLISTLVDNTRENWKVKIHDIWFVEREGEESRFNTSIGNNKLLWHGSRVTNYGGILSQGMRIAPPEAPVSGYLYGKGVYFADQFSKSAHYCRGVGDDILIMLCDVACGKEKVYERPNYNAGNLPPGHHSTKGYGTMAPPDKSYVKIPDADVYIPQGKPQRTTSSNYQGHNEFIVYNVNQVRIRYLLKVQLTR